MAETKEITKLYVVTDTENQYDDIGDIDGGGFDREWLKQHIKKYGVDGLLKTISWMNFQIFEVYREVGQENDVPLSNRYSTCPGFFKSPDGEIYPCVGNDEKKYWAEANGESIGFEQGDCTIASEADYLIQQSLSTEQTKPSCIHQYVIDSSVSTSKMYCLHCGHETDINLKIGE